MSVLEKAIKSVAMLLAEEAKTYGVSFPPIPGSDDTNSVLSYLKQVLAEIEKVAGSSSAKECLEAIEAVVNGSGSEDDLKIKCPISEDLPASPLDPFKRVFLFERAMVAGRGFEPRTSGL